MRTWIAGPMLGVLTVLGALTSSPSVSTAATITATISGIVTGVNQDNYEAKFVFDTSRGFLSCISGKCTKLIGGSATGLSNPLDYADLRINGNLVHTFTGAYNSGIDEKTGSFSIVAQDALAGSVLTFTILAATGIPRDLFLPFTLTNVLSNTTASFCVSDNCSGAAGNTLSVSSLTTTVEMPTTSTTPLPAALPLFAAGLLGLATAVLRSRRTNGARQRLSPIT